MLVAFGDKIGREIIAVIVRGELHGEVIIN